MSEKLGVQTVTEGLNLPPPVYVCFSTLKGQAFSSLPVIQAHPFIISEVRVPTGPKNKLSVLWPIYVVVFVEVMRMKIHCEFY